MQLKLRGILLLLLFSILFAVNTPAQQLTPAEMIARVEAQTATYVETFKNLLAEETKTFELYKREGNVGKRRVIVSSFLVFPLQKSADQVVEFRNVISVDGKKINDSDRRAGQLFEKIAKGESSESEINKLRDEGSRHDLEIAISGMTLYQAIAVDSVLRPSFEFDVRPSQTGDLATYSIGYRQITESPDITINASKSRPIGRAGLNYDVDIDNDGPLNARVSGTIVVDAVSYKVISEIRIVTIQPEGLAAPITVIEDRFEYQNSDFGIFTPKVITHTQYRVKMKDRMAIREMKITFEYGKFSRPEVEVKSGEVKPR